MEIRTYDEKKNKYVYVGEVKDGVFTREIKPEHFVFKYKGYGLQLDALKQLKAAKKIILRSDSLSYESDYEDWNEHGITDNLGHGIQRFLPIKYMKRIDQNQPGLFEGGEDNG